VQDAAVFAGRERVTDTPRYTSKAVSRRRSVFRKYKDTNHPAYIKAVRKSCDLVKDTIRNFERCLAKKIKENRKSFFVYVRSESKSNVTVGSLENENGQVISDSEEKSEKLNDFFCSMFTKESTSDMPVPDACFAGNNNIDKLVDIVITPQMILGKLQHLKLDKAAGNDNLSPRLLKSISNEIALPIAMIFRKSVDQSINQSINQLINQSINVKFIGRRYTTRPGSPTVVSG